MDKENGGESLSEEYEVEASGDAIIIAESIHALASAIGRLAESMRDESEPEAEEQEYYLDGKRK